MKKTILDRTYNTLESARRAEARYLDSRGLNKSGLDVCLYYPGSTEGNGKFRVVVKARK